MFFQGFRASVAIILLACISPALNAYAQETAGGGKIVGDVMGSAAIIFRKPDNPPVGGGRVSERVQLGRSQERAPVHRPSKEQDRMIAKGNAARSAPTPRYAEAEEQYRQASRMDPADARSFAGLGNVFLDQNRFSEAIEQYQQAVKLKNDYIDAYMPLGYAYVRLNRYQEAIDTYNQTLKIDPANPETFNNLGFLYNHTERFDDAVKACLEAIRLLGQTGEAFKQGYQTRNEVLAHAYKNLGNAYSGLNKFDDAVTAFKQATTVEPTSAAAFFNLGLTLYNARRYSEAIEAYQEVVKLRPTLAQAHFNLGLTYLAINDRNAALAEYNALKPLDSKMANQLSTMIKQRQ